MKNITAHTLLISIILIIFSSAACCPQKKTLSNLILQEKINATSVKNYYDLYTKVIIPELIDSINNLNNIELIPEFLENPCFDSDNMVGWKDPQIATSFREIIIMNITNIAVLEHIVNDEKYNTICTISGRHYNIQYVPYNHISNRTFAQIRLKSFKKK